jgi:hypothetical protein
MAGALGYHVLETSTHQMLTSGGCVKYGSANDRQNGQVAGTLEPAIGVVDCGCTSRAEGSMTHDLGRSARSQGSMTHDLGRSAAVKPLGFPLVYPDE